MKEVSRSYFKTTIEHRRPFTSDCVFIDGGYITKFYTVESVVFATIIMPPPQRGELAVNHYYLSVE